MIGSVFIDPENFPRVCKKIVCGPYPNQTYGFDPPAGLWKVLARVLIGSLYMPWEWNLEEGVRIIYEQWRLGERIWTRKRGQRRGLD